MTNKDITNLILNHYIRAGYQTTLSTRVDDDDPGRVAVQIDVALDPYGQFAFFYGNEDDDDQIQCSVIYEADDIHVGPGEFSALQKRFMDHSSPFKEIILDRAGDVHLYAKWKSEEVNDFLLQEIEAAFADPFGLPAYVSKMIQGRQLDTLA